jgi:hypothetical protein
MTTITYTFQSGDEVETAEVYLPPSLRPDFPSCAVLAFAKSGSVLVNAIVRELMVEVGVPVIDWPELWYARGIDMATVQANLAEIFPPHGYCFAGFRNFPTPFRSGTAVGRLRKLVVVRDPRDMLVSRYYSSKFSHGFVAKGTPRFEQVIRRVIDDCEMDLDRYCKFYSWVINADFFLHRDILADPLTLVLKYEDFVYDKEHLASAICNWFGVDVPQERLSTIIAPHDTIPIAERPDQHIRQAHPGDYLRKLKPTTISTLNDVLAEFMAAFGYKAK